MNDSPRELAARLARLEREVSRTRAIALGAVAALAATLVVGATTLHPPAALSPSALAVRDSAGHVRARLDIDGLHFYAANGRERILLGINAHQEPTLHLNDTRGTTRYSASLVPKSGFAVTRYFSSTSKAIATLAGEDEPFLRFYDNNHSWRVFLGISTLHDAMLNLSNGSGHLAAEMLGGTEPRFSLYTGSGENNRANLGIDSTGVSALNLSGSTSQVRVHLDGGELPFIRLLTGSAVERMYFGLTGQGHTLVTLNNHLGGSGYSLTVDDGAYMKLFDGSANERAYLGTYADGASGLAIYNADHSVHWSSP